VVYLDTGCLVKLYYPEPDSGLVIDRVAGQEIVYTPLHALELTTALELKRFRQEATLEQVASSLALVQEDVSSGKLVVIDAPALDSLNAATGLARMHAAETGCRALDALPCAWAKNLQISEFLSTDVRQLALARLIGLRVVELLN
jgi:predicted nucleic acid-binding protein